MHEPHQDGSQKIDALLSDPQRQRRHDTDAALALAIWNADLLLGGSIGELNRDQRECVEDIKTSVQRLKKLFEKS